MLYFLQRSHQLLKIQLVDVLSIFEKIFPKTLNLSYDLQQLLFFSCLLNQSSSEVSIEFSQLDDFTLLVLHFLCLQTLNFFQQIHAFHFGILLHSQLICINVQLSKELLIVSIPPSILLFYLFDFILESGLQLCRFRHFVTGELSLEIEKTSLGFTEKPSIQG